MPWLSGWRGAVWVHGLAGVPWVAVIVGAALRTVDRHLEEAALQDSSPGTVVRQISLRAAMPAVAAASLWVASISATEISVTDFFQVRTFAEEVYTQASLGALDGAGQGDLPAGTAWLSGGDLFSGALVPVPPVRGGRSGGGRVGGADRLRRPGQPVALGFAPGALGRGAGGAGDRRSCCCRPGREPLRQGRREGREDRRRFHPHLVGRGSCPARRREPLRAPPRTGVVGGHRGDRGNVRHRACRRALPGRPGHGASPPFPRPSWRRFCSRSPRRSWESGSSTCSTSRRARRWRGSPGVTTTRFWRPCWCSRLGCCPLHWSWCGCSCGAFRRTLWPAQPPTARGGGRCC